MKLFYIVSNEEQTRKSNIRLRDQIVGTLFSGYDDFNFTLKFFELVKCLRLLFH